VDLLLKFESLTAAEKRGEAARYNRKYKLVGNVESNRLRRNWKGEEQPVPTYENIFDIIHKCHVHTLGHAKDKRKNKIEINKMWYGVPMSAVELYLSMCPNCSTARKISKKAKRNPLKMILSTRVGHRVQVDLIDMSSSQNPVTGDNYILRYADHLSAYGHVRPIQGKASATTARAIVEIISQSVMPTILQSDNGSEFLGK
jgi:hypothetical protein